MEMTAVRALSRQPRSLLTKAAARLAAGDPRAWLTIRARFIAANPSVLRQARRETHTEADAIALGQSRWWRGIARPGQRVSRRPWRLGLCTGGRGSGKTATGANWLADQIERYPGKDWGIVAPTGPTAWDLCVAGVSGLEPVLKARGLLADTTSSRGKIALVGGGTVFVDGADDGAPSIEGKNLSGCWCDEVGIFKVTQWRRAWLQAIQPAVRLAPAPGVKASILATGTPKRGHPLIKWLLNNADWVHRMTMAENAANLAPDMLTDLMKAYAGTSLEGQELQGHYLEQVPGALWNLDLLDADRVVAPADALAPVALERIVVAWDPAVTNAENSDEHGIVAGARGADGHGYVLGDWSGKYTPTQAARKVCEVYHLLKADRVVAEVNNGGDFVETLLRQVDANVAYLGVHAAQGKRARAEPVAALAEQHRVHHVGRLLGLEEELTGWDGTGKSPNRLDALVWAMFELILDGAGPSARWM